MDDDWKGNFLGSTRNFKSILSGLTVIAKLINMELFLTHQIKFKRA